MPLKPIFAGLAFLLSCGVAHADTVGLTSFTGGIAAASPDGKPAVIGWVFTANNNLMVTSLGLFDPTAYGYTNSDLHRVGLWNSSGQLLASVAVNESGSAVDGFYFDAIAPVLLSASSAYTLGAQFYADQDRYVTSTTSHTTSSDITYLNGVYTDSSSFVDPTTNAITANGRFGPNLTYSVVAATPEPSSIALLATGMAGLAAMGRRRRLLGR